MTAQASVWQIVGVLGFALYMLAYAGLQLGKLSGAGLAYTWMNMAAAALVLVSLVEHFNLASMLIQIAWIAISIVGLRRHLQHRYA